MNRSNRNESLSDDEDDFTDYASYAEEKRSPTELKLSRDELRDLLNNKGVVLEPQSHDFSVEDEESERQYFDMDAEKLEEYLKSQREGLEDDNDDSDLTLFERKSQKMVNLYENGLVKKRMLSPGLEADGFVPQKATVVIHFALTVDGLDEPIDSTYLRDRKERHRLGCGALIPGLEIAIQSMKKKEKSEFYIDSQLAFGELGCPPRIPPKASIMAKVELLDFAEEGEAEAMLSLPPEERSKQYSFQDILKIAAKQHAEGNRFASKDQSYKSAARCFDQAIKLLEDTDLANDQEEAEQKRLLKKLYSNKGYCCVKIGWPKKACMALQDALKINGCHDPSIDTKIYYRYGLAKKMLGNFEEALIQLKRAHNLSPSDVLVGKEIANVDNIIKRQKDDEKALFRRMMNNRPTNNRSQQNNGGHSRPMASCEDEDFAEIRAQLEAFALDQGAKEYPLPSGIEAFIPVIRNMSYDLNLTLEQSGPKNHWKVTK